MKVVFIVILFAASAFAQDQAAVAAAESACGPQHTSFNASTDDPQHPVPQPDPDKAMVFVVETFGCAKCMPGHAIGTDVTLKVGADGAWVGADRGNSYLYFSVPAGEHHLCVNWQSRLPWYSQAFAMTSLTAEAGKTYYFRARLLPNGTYFFLDLDPVDVDEGKFVVASSPYSVSQPKK